VKIYAATLLALVLGTSLYGAHRSLGWGASPRPPDLADARAWVWATAQPGANVYLSSHSAAGRSAARWVDYRYSAGPASVASDLIELREFDCQARRSRRVRGSAVDSVSARWQVAGGGSETAPLVALACGSPSSLQASRD
jgi:hypothetical protein